MPSVISPLSINLLVFILVDMAFRDEAGLETTGSMLTGSFSIKSPGYNSDITQASIEHINFNYWLRGHIPFLSSR